MSEQRDLFFKCGVCGIIGAALGLIGPLVIAGHREALLKADIEYSDQRIAHHDATIEALQCANDSLDLVNADLWGLYLATLDSVETNATELDAFHPVILTADRRALHRIADSLIAGYYVNRGRYFRLINARSPGHDVPPDGGPAGAP